MLTSPINLQNTAMNQLKNKGIIMRRLEITEITIGLKFNNKNN